MLRRALFALGSVLVGCSTHDASRVDPTTKSDSAIPDVAIVLDVGPYDSTATYDTDRPDAVLDTPDPPAIHCSTASPQSGPACNPPSPLCADDHWLMYYVDGQCVDGSCRFEQSFFHCNRGCKNGGCLPESTAF